MLSKTAINEFVNLSYLPVYIDFYSCLKQLCMDG